MSAIRLATAANVRAFQNLVKTLSTGNSGHPLDLEAIEDEFGRVRVWCGNIGALQKGHSSLDYRLRDSPLLSSNVLKLLQELEENLNAALDIISGLRLPYEQQRKPEETDPEEEDDFFSEDEEDETSDVDAPKTELEMRFREVVDVIDSLYKLSVRIRTPSVRARSLKAAAYQPRDDGVNVLDQYAGFDLRHTQELVRDLKTSNVKPEDIIDNTNIVGRLARAITLRRRQFMYWKRHRDKLGLSTSSVEEPQVELHVERPVVVKHDTLDVHPSSILQKDIKETPSQKTGRTFFSATEATHHHQSLDDLVDSKSVTSYATTVRDVSGKGVSLPPPPKAADGDKDFECPFCWIICPARYGQGRAWRTHVLQDLQPYICTYEQCDKPDQLFRSRRDWLEHEATHRKAFRCAEHPKAVYVTGAALEDHFRREHAGSFSENQLHSIVKASETSTVDVRPNCPICEAPIAEGINLQSHIAHHLERIAAFALPLNAGDDSEGASSQASRGRTDSTGSQDLSAATFSNNSSDDQQIFQGKAQVVGDMLEQVTAHPGAAQPRNLLSAELLRSLPDASHGLDRIDTLFTPQQTDVAGNGSPSPDKAAEESQSYPEPPSLVLKIEHIPTLQSMYRSERLLQRDQSYVPNNVYNRIISFSSHDMIQIEAQAIVNSANRGLTSGQNSVTLNERIHKASGPELAAECKSIRKLSVGEAVITRGYNLPSDHIIHVARPPDFGQSEATAQLNILAQCYRNALELALEHNIKTVVFPTLGAGGCGYPPRLATKVALQETRDFLDAHALPFERICFCAYSEPIIKAYEAFLPIYFPPTHDDVAEDPQKSSRSRTVLGTQLMDAYISVHAITQEFALFQDHMSGFSHNIIEELASIKASLVSLKDVLMSPTETIPGLNENTASNVELACAVSQIMAGSVMEIIELAKGKSALGQPSYQEIWDDYNNHIRSSQGFDIVLLLETLQDFTQRLEDVVVRNGEVPQEISTLSVRLENWLTKQSGKDKDARDHFDEIMYTREFQRDVVASPPTDLILRRTDVVKLHQIPSIARMYQHGELEPKPTLAVPSIRWNHVVSLIRSDISRLETDVIVNCTDPEFSGVGTLDRTIFKRGGPDMQRECARFGKCKPGDVRITAGFLLPAKYVLHVVPAHNKDSRIVLQKIYREILDTAVALKATSIAIPAIGTGMLNYRKHDTAVLALEAVKRFLESMDSHSPIERIIFDVYGSNDEMVYRSLIPTFFPPPDSFDQPLPTSSIAPSSSIQVTTADGLPSAPRKTLFTSIGKAFRGVLGKPPTVPTGRLLDTRELDTLMRFERHAGSCTTCSNIHNVYLEGRNLCADGYEEAQHIVTNFNMESDHSIWSLLNHVRRERVDVPTKFRLSWELLTTVEQSLRDHGRGQPFVSPDLPWPGEAVQDQQAAAVPPGVTIYNAEVAIPREPEGAMVIVHVWSEDMSVWQPLQQSRSSLHIFPGELKLRVFSTGDQIKTQEPLISLELTPMVTFEQCSSTELIGNGFRISPGSKVNFSSRILLGCESPTQCDALLQRLKHAAEENLTYWQDTSAPKDNVTSRFGTDEPTSLDVQSALGPEIRTSRTSTRSAVEERKSSGLHGRIANLALASTSLDPADSGPRRGTKALSISLLGRKILARLGSVSQPSAGLHQQQIADELGKDITDVSKAIEHLQTVGLVHPVFGSKETWVAAYIPEAGSASTERRPHGKYRDILRVEESEADASEIDEEWICQLPPNGEDDALANDLLTLDIAERPKEGPAHPNTPTTETIELFTSDSSSSVKIEDYYTFLDMLNLSAVWTMIDRRLVNPRALKEAGEEYEERAFDSVIVRRKLNTEEVKRLVERTDQIRQGESMVKPTDVINADSAPV